MSYIIKKKKKGAFLSQIDTSRNTLLKKQEDISKLNQDMAKELSQIAPLQKKIIIADKNYRNEEAW